jgi:5-methylthioadenosine/S-adenosylhomocysteine deaminase
MTRTLIHNGAICTPQGWISHGYVLIDGQQISLVSAGSPPADLAWDKKIDASGQAILPGLENAHTHLSQTFMRGLAGGRPLIRWLKERIWPIQALMTPELLHLAALLGLVENLRCGNTHVVNHHKVAANTSAQPGRIGRLSPGGAQGIPGQSLGGQRRKRRSASVHPG